MTKIYSGPRWDVHDPHENEELTSSVNFRRRQYDMRMDHREAERKRRRFHEEMEKDGIERRLRREARAEEREARREEREEERQARQARGESITRRRRVREWEEPMASESERSPTSTMKRLADMADRVRVIGGNGKPGAESSAVKLGKQNAMSVLI